MKIYLVMEEGYETPYLDKLFLDKSIAERYIKEQKNENLYIEEEEPQDKYFENIDDSYYQIMHFQASQKFSEGKIVEDSLKIKNNVETLNACFHTKPQSASASINYHRNRKVHKVVLYLSFPVPTEKKEQEKWTKLINPKMVEWIEEICFESFDKVLDYPMEQQKVKKPMYDKIEQFVKENDLE